MILEEVMNIFVMLHDMTSILVSTFSVISRYRRDSKSVN